MRFQSSMLALGVALGTLLAAPAFAFPAVNAPAQKVQTAHQQKMAKCAHDSKGMNGEAHKKFMSNCLRGKSHTRAPSKSQERMKSCNATAKSKSLKGAARKSFMRKCLNG